MVTEVEKREFYRIDCNFPFVPFLFSSQDCVEGIGGAIRELWQHINHMI